MISWLPATKLYVPLWGDAKNCSPFQFRNDGVSAPWPYIELPQSDTWTLMDLNNGPQWGDETWQPNIPDDVVGMFITIWMCITGGPAELYCNFRAPGSHLPGQSYLAHTLTYENAPAGVRTNAPHYVPLVDKTFEFYWHYKPGVPSALNASVQFLVAL